MRAPVCGALGECRNMHWEDKLATDLKLMVTGQDLGIINADGKRLSEFIHYFQNNIAIDPWEWEELLDLILESANEAILEKYITIEEMRLIKDILLNQNSKFPEQLKYWSEFGNSEGCYPIVDIVNEVYPPNKSLKSDAASGAV